ncbi:tubulin domain-containing protein [Gautieria morchelliformis]|nr:tubulin domain-containing protein [Gautieria morchelliformis]
MSVTTTAILTDSDVPQGSTTFCPRLLLIDYKSKFGSLSHINALNVGEEDAPKTSGQGLFRSISRTPSCRAHIRLDAGEDEEDEDDLDVEMDEGEHDSVPDLTSSIRFWSDYSCMFYHPRGLHHIPDPAEWEREAGWPHVSRGSTRTTRDAYTQNQAVLEDSFRLFAEECHLLQGVQLCMDTPSFGSFTVSLLSRFRDEYPKLPVLSFCSLSRHDPAEVNLENTPGCVNALNDALTLNELAALLTLVVPLQSPTTWCRRPWSEHLKVDHTSALLVAHIESSTLPLRLNASVPSSTDLASLCAQLNWRGNTPFIALSGAFPVTPSPPALEILIRLFTPCLTAQVPFAQRDVYRGLDAREKAAVQSWVVDAELAVGSDMGRLGRGEQPACFQGVGKAVEGLLR